MKEIILSFMFGASVGLGMLLCPQIRHYVEKTSQKISKKLQKMKEVATEETSD